MLGKSKVEARALSSELSNQILKNKINGPLCTYTSSACFNIIFKHYFLYFLKFVIFKLFTKIWKTYVISYMYVLEQTYNKI